MTEQETETKSQIEIISLDELKAVNVNELFAGHEGSDAYSLTKPLSEVRAAAEEAGEEDRH